MWPIVTRAQQQVEDARIGILTGGSTLFRGPPARVPGCPASSRSDRRTKCQTAFVRAAAIRRPSARLGRICRTCAGRSGPMAAGDVAGRSRRQRPFRSYLHSSPIPGIGLRAKPGWTGRQRHQLYEFEYSLSGKWLELLKEMVPGVRRAASFETPPFRPASAVRVYRGRGGVAGNRGQSDHVRDPFESSAIQRRSHNKAMSDLSSPPAPMRRCIEI